MVVIGGVPVRQEEFSAYLEKNGQEYKAAKLPDDVERGVPKECFKNASQLVIGRDDLEYVEGIAYPGSLRDSGLGFLHAWAVKKDGTVVDNTWDKPEDAKYFGVKYDRNAYMKHLMKTEMYGVFGGKDSVTREVLERGGL
jgi:hypothetical protein